MSLIESAVAVAIAGLGLAVAVPSIHQSREIYLQKSAAADVATALYGAKIKAIAQGADCRMRVLTPSLYVVECQTESGSWTETNRQTLPKGFTITANNKPEFHRRGNVSPTATVTIWNAAGRALRIIVNANGRVRTQ
ncbi:MAG TPA: hypothetical protein VFY29_19110 [Terriglobia bacterium]|nr:hypothetical protein [Terriglobia bacterium]